MMAMDRPLTHFALAVLVALLLPFFTPSGTLATEVLIFAIAAAGCNLLLGYTGLLSFGQGIFFGLGSYTLGLVLINTTLPLLPTLVLAMVAGCVVAIIIGALSIRRQGVYFVMLTLAFAQLFYFLAYTFSDITGGDNGLTGVPRRGIGPLTLNSSWSYYAFVAIIFLVSFAALQRIATSTFGRTLLAIRDNGERAQAIGFPIRIFKVAAFAVSGAVTGLAGALHARLHARHTDTQRLGGLAMRDAAEVDAEQRVTRRLRKLFEERTQAMRELARSIVGLGRGA